MFNSGYTGKLISSVFITGLLTYVMFNTTSPKIVFVPFLICAVSMALKTVGQIFEKEGMIFFFDKLFKGGFFLYGFGFLIFFDYLALKDKQYGLVIYSLLFWAVLLFVFKRVFFNNKQQAEKPPKVNIAKFAASGLVIVSFLAGVVLLVLGIGRKEAGIIFAGAFFALVSSVFILFHLSVSGFFKKIKTDILGLYIGIVSALVGIGIPIVKFTEVLSVKGTIKSFGLWIFVPIILFSAGVFQIIKTLRNRKDKD